MFAIGSGFGVTKAGKLYARNANIGGSIYADYIEAGDGTIGGWTIGTTSLSAGGCTLNSNGTISGGTITGSNLNISHGSGYLK